jgi:hypothetical protein
MVVLTPEVNLSWATDSLASMVSWLSGIQAPIRQEAQWLAVRV